MVQAETQHLGADTRLPPCTDGPRWYCSTSPVSFLQRAHMTAARGQTACAIFTPHFDNVCVWPQFKLQRKANTPRKASILAASYSALTPRWMSTPACRCGLLQCAGQAAVDVGGGCVTH